MHRFIKPFCLALVINILSMVGQASAYDGGDLCEALLTQGIRDTQTVNVSNSQFNEIHSQVCNANFDSYSKAQSNSKSGGLDVPGYFGVSAADANADSEYSTKWTNFCGSDYGKSMSDSQLSTFVSTINVGLLHSFDHCVDLNSTTFIRYVQPDPSGKVFTIVLDDRNDGIPNFTITQLTLLDTTSGRHLDPTRDCNLPHATPYFSGHFNHVNILCKKPAPDDVVVSGTTTAGLVDTVTVPGIPNAPASIADRVSTLEGEVSALSAQLKLSDTTQTTSIKSIEGQIGNLQIGVAGHVTLVASSDSFIATFPFNVAHAWVEPVGNFTNMDEFKTSYSGSSVTVVAKMHGTGGGGAGIVQYNVWATSF